MRRTKIICTIGPASEKPEVFREMCLAGLNVARLNFSHGTHEEHQKKIDMIKAVREELNLPIPIMLDTKGPEYRIKTFRDGKIQLKDGDSFTFTTRDVAGDESIVSVNYAGLCDDLAVGDRILVNNGLVIFEVEAIEDMLYEFGRKHVSNMLAEEYLMEHGERIIDGNALQVLAETFA